MGSRSWRSIRSRDIRRVSVQFYFEDRRVDLWRVEAGNISSRLTYILHHAFLRWNFVAGLERFVKLKNFSLEFAIVMELCHKIGIENNK